MTKALQEYDDNGNLIYRKNSNGYEWWNEYDENGKLTCVTAKERHD
jgi:YD repeat-containing protein